MQTLHFVAPTMSIFTKLMFDCSLALSLLPSQIKLFEESFALTSTFLVHEPQQGIYHGN